jgi:hypothetical protein
MSGSQIEETNVDRRSEERVATIYRPVLIETAEFAGFCLVRNLSSTGMMGQVYTSLAVGTPIEVDIDGEIPVPGQVAWSRDDKIGISFDIQVEVGDVLKRLSHRSHRGNASRAPRLPLQIAATFLVADRPLPVELQDISQKGLKVRTTALTIDDEVTVCLPGLDQRKAVVRWTQAGVAGLNFYRPIPYDQLGEWVIRQQLGETLFVKPTVGAQFDRPPITAVG